MTAKERFAVDFTDTPFPDTSLTAANPYRLNWRCEILLSRNHEAIKGKKILDLGSHDGRFIYACLKLGAKHVVGVEGRDYLIDSSINTLTEIGYTKEQYHLIQDDVFNYLGKVKPGQFDTILCLGFFDHTIRQIELVREITRIQPTTVLLDMFIERGFFLNIVNPLKLINGNIISRFTGKRESFENTIISLDINKAKPCLVFRFENHEKEGSTIDPVDTTARPNSSFVEYIFKAHGFDVKRLKWNKKEISNRDEVRVYLRNTRATYIAHPVE